MKPITIEAADKSLAEIAKQAVEKANQHPENLVEVALDFYGKRVTMHVAPHANPESVCESLTQAKSRCYDNAIWDNKFKILEALPKGANIRVNHHDIWVEVPSSTKLENVADSIKELLYLDKADKINGLSGFKIEKTPELERLFKQTERELKQQQPSRRL